MKSFTFIIINLKLQSVQLRIAKMFHLIYFPLLFTLRSRQFQANLLLLLSTRECKFHLRNFTRYFVWRCWIASETNSFEKITIIVWDNESVLLEIEKPWKLAEIVRETWWILKTDGLWNASEEVENEVKDFQLGAKGYFKLNHINHLISTWLKYFLYRKKIMIHSKLIHLYSELSITLKLE
jgi:hypothetical protein